jgi:hypothetical protein
MSCSCNPCEATPSTFAIPETSEETFRISGRGLLHGSRFRVFDKAAQFVRGFQQAMASTRIDKRPIERYANTNFHNTHRCGHQPNRVCRRQTRRRCSSSWPVINRRRRAGYARGTGRNAFGGETSLLRPTRLWTLAGWQVLYVVVSRKSNKQNKQTKRIPKGTKHL